MSVALVLTVLATLAIAQDTSSVPLYDLSTAPPSLTNATPELPPLLAPQPVTGPQPAGTSQLAGPPPAAAVPPLPLLQWGPITFRPHVFYSISYGNGLQAAPGQPANTLINEIDPGILFQLGDHWTLDYTPTLRYYSNDSFRNTFDNRVVLAGLTSSRDWTLSFSQSYFSSSQPLVETGSQLDQETYPTVFNATYRMSTALSLELAANQVFQFQNQNTGGQQLSDWRSWSTLDWLNYQLLPSLGTAIGVGFGYDNVSIGSDMTSEQLQARISWRVRTKLNFVLSGGVEDRQYLASGAPDSLTPIFALTAQYQLFEQTTLFLSGGRTVSPALFQDQITENTTLGGGVNQRLLGVVYLNVSGAYSKTVYHSTTVASTASGGSDYNSTSLNVSLNTTFLKRASASVFCQLAYYSSNVAAYNYNTTQVGLSLGYRF